MLCTLLGTWDLLVDVVHSAGYLGVWQSLQFLHGVPEVQVFTAVFLLEKHLELMSAGGVGQQLL